MTIENLLSKLRSGLPPAPREDLELASTRSLENPRCARCGQLPEDMEEYMEGLASVSTEEAIELARAKARADGTFNHQVGSFFCTACYIEVGQPLGKAP